MWQRLSKVNYALIISLSFHIALIVAALLAYNSYQGKADAVGINIISSNQFSEICPDHKIKKKSRAKKINFFKSKSENFLAEVKKEEESDKNKNKVNDLGYTKEVYEIGSKQNPPPPYPRVAKLRNLQGKVEICIISDINGNVLNAEIHKTSGHYILDNSALKTVKNWRLDIKKESQDVAQNQYFRVIVPISFVIN